MNILFHHLTYIGVQKIQNLCQNFIIMFIVCSLCHFDQVMYYNYVSLMFVNLINVLVLMKFYLVF